MKEIKPISWLRQIKKKYKLNISLTELGLVYNILGEDIYKEGYKDGYNDAKKELE